MFFAGIWLVYLVPLVSSAFGHRHGVPSHPGALVAIALAFAIVYVAVVGWWDRRRWFATPGIIALFGLATGASIFCGGSATGLWIYVSAASGLVIGARGIAARAVALAVGAYVLFSLIDHVTTSDFLTSLLPVLFGGFAALSVRARIATTRELVRARETVAHLAASEERLRLARDMHDLTGQSLSTITLKLQLAGRVLARLPDSPERDRAAEEVAEAADVSRQALTDIREAISGYRRPTLAVEAITARTALEAAGITAHDDTALTLALSPGSAAGSAPGPLAAAGSLGEEASGPGGQGAFCPDSEAALAWCLREAVTNVVRHSGARNCWLTLRRSEGAVILEVRDDGRGLASAPAGRDAQGGGGVIGMSGDHSGLRGMSERLSAVGGSLEIRPNEGFCLIATVPSRQGASVAR
jgi:two-component system sensor histidine kinase DesK